MKGWRAYFYIIYLMYSKWIVNDRSLSVVLIRAWAPVSPVDPGSPRAAGAPPPQPPRGAEGKQVQIKQKERRHVF